MTVKTRDIIVVGASAGGFDALKTLAAGFPPDLPAAVYVVWHMAPDVEGVLPRVLGGAGPLPAAHAVDGERIERGRITIAPPDRHLLLEDGRVRVTNGPKENRFRPAVDPLFRSAVYAYGGRVIGVVLSGSLDDGAAGLWLVKRRGGVAVVQDPRDAAVPAMPESALRAVAVDHVVAVADMPALLSEVCREAVGSEEATMARSGEREDEVVGLEVDIAAGDTTLGTRLFEHAELTPYSCPECHGVLARLREGDRVRFRCHTGHAYSAASLLAALDVTIEESLFSALRGIDERVMLLNHVANIYGKLGVHSRVEATLWARERGLGA